MAARLGANQFTRSKFAVMRTPQRSVNQLRSSGTTRATRASLCSAASGSRRFRSSIRISRRCAGESAASRRASASSASFRLANTPTTFSTSVSYPPIMRDRIRIAAPRGGLMTRAAAIAILCLCVSGFAQRPTNPALLIPQEAPALDYHAVPDALALPAGVTMGPPASVAFDSKGHLWVLNRGPQAILEFDQNERFLRALGQG